MLGFRSAYESTRYSQFGSVPEVFAMDGVYCNGDEDSLFDCEFEDEDDCLPDEGAGVICNAWANGLLPNVSVHTRVKSLTKIKFILSTILLEAGTCIFIFTLTVNLSELYVVLWGSISW